MLNKSGVYYTQTVILVYAKSLKTLAELLDLMALPNILATKDPSDFVSQRVKVTKNNSAYYAEFVGHSMSFDEMASLRRYDADPDEIKYNISSSDHIFAGIGVNADVTVQFKGKRYSLLVTNYYPDIECKAAKPVSGYFDSRFTPDLLAALDEEISEELIMLRKNGRLLPGVRRSCLHALPLSHPYKDIARYDSNSFFMLSENKQFSLPGLLTSDFYLDGKKITDPNFGFYFQAPNNFVQAVFSYSLDFPTSANRFDDQSAVTLMHADDMLSKDGKTLEILLHESGLLLVELDENRLTDKVYNLVDDSLVKLTDELMLAHTHAPKSDGIAADKKISLVDYLSIIKKP